MGALSSLLSSFSLMKLNIPRSIERFPTTSKAVTLTRPIRFKLVRVTRSILKRLPFKKFQVKYWRYLQSRWEGNWLILIVKFMLDWECSTGQQTLPVNEPDCSLCILLMIFASHYRPQDTHKGDEAIEQYDLNLLYWSDLGTYSLLCWLG